MQAHYTERFLNSLMAAPPPVQKAFHKQIRLLLKNLRHPSLHAKKYSEKKNIWQARITRDWRLYFSVANSTYILYDITRHPK
jgi:mRNA-degrading endonuclease RelE of RelBE toxin-antitoxin system